MTQPRYVVLGLARARAPWFTDVARWATAATLPAQFVKCVSAEEVRSRLGSGRVYSALLVDASLGVLDRDLAAAAARQGCVVVAVAEQARPLDLDELGLAARLRPDFDRSELLEVLAGHAHLVSDTVATSTVVPEGHGSVLTPWSGSLVAVCGPGGTGASTVAAALAQGLSSDPRLSGLIVLADLALHADQAVLHGTPDVVPGLPELVDAHRRGRPEPAEVRRLTFAVPDRGYQLLLGLRRHRDWVTLRPRSVEAALQGLRHAFHLVIADVDTDLEGEAQSGSSDLEDRNVLARTTLDTADVVVVVGNDGVKGLHALVRTMQLLDDHGVPPEVVIPVFNRAPRRASRRAELARALAELTAPVVRGQSPPPALFLPDRAAIDGLHRDGLRLPAALATPSARAVRALLDRGSRSVTAHDQPVAISPGTLGSWADVGSADG